MQSKDGETEIGQLFPLAYESKSEPTITFKNQHCTLASTKKTCTVQLKDQKWI